MIAVDVMGGDYAPRVVLEGALSAAKNSIPVMLCGPQIFIYEWLDAHDGAWQNYPISITDAHDVITMDEEPVLAVRKKTASSLVQAVQQVAGGSCSAVLSAGNSGALMIAATLVIGKNDGIARPAIAGFLPTTKQPVLALDLGANTECRPDHLQQFAHMGCDYLRETMQQNAPRVGILSNGQEARKGSVVVKQTHALLHADTLNFIGNLEPQHIFTGYADVVVCDGFAGNVLLKTMESMTELMLSMIAPADASRVWQRVANRQMGGALLLGIKECVIVCHGNSDAHTIENAIRNAWEISSRK